MYCLLKKANIAGATGKVHARERGTLKRERASFRQSGCDRAQCRSPDVVFDWKSDVARNDQDRAAYPALTSGVVLQDASRKRARQRRADAGSR
jgi:hypothetical protein